MPDMPEHNKRLLKEAAEYFKSKKGYKSMFLALKEKYESIGRVGGRINLKNITVEESEALKGFLRKNYSVHKNASISVSEIEKALATTKFGEIPLENILEEYFQAEMISKKDSLKREEDERDEFFKAVFSGISHKKTKYWFGEILITKEPPYLQLIRRYEKDREGLKESIIAVSDGIEMLESTQSLKRMAVFAADITGDPHYFDDGTEANGLLTAAMCYFLKAPLPTNAQERSEIFLKWGLAKDDISSYTVTIGLTGRRKEGVHKGMAGFASLMEPLHLSLLNLWDLEEVYTAYKNNIVYVVENPSVFSGILDELGDEDIEISMICSNGQPRLSTLLLMDKLCKNNIVLYYAGDFDPEGLQIALRLKKRYGNKLKFWRYGIEDYNEAMSNRDISDFGCQKLKNIINKNAEESKELEGLISEMLKNKYSGYQETILHRYVEDII